MNGHVRVERRRFRKVAGPSLGFDGLVEHVEASNDGFAFGRRHVAGQYPHGRCLAGAIRSEKAQNFTALHPKADVVYGGDTTVALSEVLNLDHGTLLV